jgi:release factor glutamine methyltransferase
MGKTSVNVLGLDLIILPGMFAPKWGDSSLLAKVVSENIKKDELVLDLGTGSGIQGIFASKRGAMVIAVDVNPKAIESAKENAVANGVSDRVEFRISDLFANVKEKFDVILFNPPFRWFKPRDLLERGQSDENYATLTSFFHDAKAHLNESGRILLVFSDSGDIAYVNKLIEDNGYTSIVVDKEKAESGWTYIVYEIRKGKN